MAGHTEKGSTGEPFAGVWATTSNPLIPWYFQFTDEAPCNDAQLPWCAAFISWTLVLSGQMRLPFADVAGSESALRCHARPSIDAAEEGDVVFLTRADGGHVAFFVRWERKDKSKVRLLGGNQCAPRSVCETTITLTKPNEAVQGGKQRLEFVVPASAFRPVEAALCVPAYVEECDHLVATNCETRTWPACR